MKKQGNIDMVVFRTDTLHTVYIHDQMQQNNIFNYRSIHFKALIQITAFIIHLPTQPTNIPNEWKLLGNPYTLFDPLGENNYHKH